MTDKVEMKEITVEEYSRLTNTYEDYISSYVEGFMSKLYSADIIDEIDMETLKKYFSNPDHYQKELENLTQYYYIASGEVHMLYELVEALPTLNYKLESFESSAQYDKHLSIINKTMHKVKHKRLTRDILKQSITAGTLVGIWLGGKNSVYPLIFDNIKYIFPSRRLNGEWQVAIDLEWFREMPEMEREFQLENLSPYVSKSDYSKYINDTSNEKYKYIHLPQDRTFTIRTNILKRNQNLGTSWATAGFYDVLHKKKLKDLEKAVANKIINAIAVLTIGSEAKDEYSSLKLNPNLKRKIHSRVKAALEKNESKGISLISLPEFSDIKFPDIKGGDSLKSDKFESTNADIQSALGISGAMLNGTGGNHASSKMNSETLYKRIAVLLEEIEYEVYGKLFNIILPKNQKDNYKMEYDKEAPLTLKEKIDTLKSLNDKGWSTKHLIDNISGVSWDSYLQQTLHETETLSLQDKLVPYKSSHTTSSKDDVGGRPESSDGELSEGGAKTRDNNGNDI